MKKILVAAGGTGGHVYPAIALAEKLKEKGIQIHFAGGMLSTNPYFQKDSFPFTDISCGSWRKKGLLFVKEGISLCKGIFEGLKFLKSYQPDLVVGFGSYHTFPVLCAARIAGYPYILHEANALPGKVIKVFSSRAVFTGVHFPEASSHMKGKTLEVSLPSRKGYYKGIHLPETARQSFGLDPDLLTCLLFGGSQGAEVLNLKLIESLPEIKKEKIQFIHVTGDSKSVNEVSSCYKQNGIKAYVTPFETRMDLAWSAADFAVTRAGANTIAEAIEFEVPLILIPYPFAADQHQDKNADFLVDQVGSGIKIQQPELSSALLSSHINRLADDFQILKMWKEKMKQYKQNVKSKQLDQEIINYLGTV